MPKIVSIQRWTASIFHTAAHNAYLQSALATTYLVVFVALSGSKQKNVDEIWKRPGPRAIYNSTYFTYIHQTIPNTGGQTFFASISVGVCQQTECIRTGGQSDQINHIDNRYLHLMSHPRACATEIEIVAAQQLYVRVAMAANPSPCSYSHEHILEFIVTTRLFPMGKSLAKPPGSQ